MIARDSSFHKTMLYNESFLNTAVMAKSVYNWAKMFNINITSATPAYADILVTIAIEDIENPQYSINYFGTNESRYGSEVTSTNRRMLILDRANPFIAGELNFYDGEICFSLSFVRWIWFFYCQILRNWNPYNKLWTIGKFFPKEQYFKNWWSWISFIHSQSLSIWRTELTKQISSASFLDTKIHKFEFADQFVGARLYYRKGTSAKEEIELRFSNISSDNILDNTTKFAYYNLTAENEIQISFSSSSEDFIPSANSTLYLDLYTTQGESGNIEYTGELIFRLKDEALRNLPVLAIFFNPYSIGGIDRPSISKIKK